MSYNFLREARSISNSYLCRYDTLNGYVSDFKNNGDVGGWDVYYNTYLYGSWSGVLFGTAFARTPYIGRTVPFSSVEAETYYYINIMMKLTNNNTHKVVGGLTTGKIRWTTIEDNTWTADKEIEFDIVSDDKWRLYTINLGPEVKWVGYVDNLRIYPFTDGWSGDQFAIKYIKISSSTVWTCSNTQCSYYTQYEHNCPGAGVRGSCEAGISKTSYTTISGVSGRLTINIDDYGDEIFELGTNEGVSGIEMSKIISNKLSTLNIGGYSYVTVEYSEEDKIKITSGTTGTLSSVVVSSSSSAASALGFDTSELISGTTPATGFDYASSRLLTAYEINKLIDGNKENFAYIHDPRQYAVEGGRNDFNQVGTSVLTTDIHGGTYHDSISNRGKTLLDVTHPFNNNGRVKTIYVYGKIYGNSKIKICRPHSNGEYTVVYSLDVPQEDAGKMYTAMPINSRIDCDILVNKGDYIGIYDMDVYVGKSLGGTPDATYTQYNGEASGRFDPGKHYSFGVAGFAIYGKGDRWQTNTILDIDLNNRTNIEQVNVYGSEREDYFEFNIMSCLDVDWEVNVFGETHGHGGTNVWSSASFFHTHSNLAIGTECLADMIVTPDNGDAGNALQSTAGTHAYFYVTGDAEWLFGECGGKYEYCQPMYPTSLVGYNFDPIAFTVYFPNEYTTRIHKSIMHFKERGNFRSFALSYYLGRYDSTGNADINTFKLIPSFNEIVLDNIVYNSTNNEEVIDYIFQNPSDSRPSESNRTAFIASINADWTIIEHEFDEVETCGFRIYCNEHYSTKITELELYSKLESDPSLADNISMTYSDYGTTWATASFNEVSGTEINAFVGGSPRYLRLEIDSSTEFELNEIELLVGDQLKLEDCEEVVLLEESKRDVVNASKAIVLENIYDKPFDLYVDLPKEISGTSTGLIFWSKLGSMEEIQVPEVGPACILRKADNYQIVNDNAQCAINDPAYGLKNLVHNKEAYHNRYDEDWTYHGTLISGTSIDFSNSGDKDLKVSEFTFNDASFSAQYWKFIFTNNTIIGAVKHIFAFYDDTPFEIEKIYYLSDAGVASQDDSIVSDGVEIDITDYNDDFTGANGDPPNGLLWGVNTYAQILNNRLQLKADSGDNYGSVVSTYNLQGDFDVQGDWYLITWPSTNGWNSTMQIHSTTTSWVYRMQRFYTNANYYNWEQRNAGGTWSSGGLIGNSDASGKFRFTRIGDTITAYRWLSGDWSQFKQWTGSEAVTDDVKITLYAYSNTGLPSVEMQWDNFVVNEGLITTAGFGFKIPTNDLVNSIKFFHTSSTLVDVEVYISPDNTSNYSLVDDNITGNLNIVKNNQTYYQYFAIDLEKRHDLEIIRNYGTATNKLFLSTSNYVDYSNTNTSTVGDVVWDNSTKDDARWIRISLSCSDGTTKIIRKLGIYPDIRTTFCIGGGYNCEWEDLGLTLAGYETSVNVAYGAVVTGTNSYYHTFYPSNAVDGVFDDYSTAAAWGFKTENGEDPYLKMEFDAAYTIDKAVLFHGLDPNDDRYMNNDYSLKVAYSDYNPGSVAIAYGSPQYNNGALEFNGSTDYVIVKYISGLTFGNSDFQINARVRIHALGGTQYIFQRPMPEDGGTTDLIYLQVDSSTGKFRGSARNESEFTVVDLYSTTVVVPGTLYDVAFVRDNYTFRIFVNGIQESSFYSEQYIDNSETSFNIGADPVDGGYLDGTIEELKVSTVTTWSGSGNYTPESGDYTWTSGTILLFHFDGEIYFEAFSVTGNSLHEKTNYFTPMLAHGALLTITGYDTETMYFVDEDTGELTIFDGSFLKEIELYTYNSFGYIDSETWPVVCVNLQDQFNILNHALINKNPNDTDTDWDNDDEYFQYSDNVLDDPEKVAFTRSGSEVNVYYSGASSGNMEGSLEYVFSENTYIPAGTYSVSCQMYDVDYLDEISMRIEGSEIIDVFPDATAGGTWQDVNAFVEVSADGFYSIKGVQHIDRLDDWGVRYPRIYRTYGLSKWLAVTRDTATNYSWDDDSAKYGLDYLSLIKVYGDTKYKPTEYNWWWSSTLSTLDNDYLIVNEDSRSLKIAYPTSSGVDTVTLREGDDLGQDVYWSVKDSLGFRMYVDDISKMDTSYGDITFGILFENPNNYYVWNIENLNLSTGWNHIKLKFEDADSTYPVVEDHYVQSYMDGGLDFRMSGKDMTSFRFRYRGKGASFNIYITDLKIERNIFDDDVKFGKGLCLVGSDYLEIPLNGLTLEKGTIEFWIKPYCDSYGIDIFGVWNSRTLFTITNNNNNIVALAIKAGNWFELTSGHVRRNCNIFTEEDDLVIIQNYIEINDLLHIAISWSNDGNYMDNKDTFRFYIGGVLMYISKKTWEVSDTKSALIKLGGGNTQLASGFETFGGSIFDNIKIYDYCKDTFNINEEGIEKDLLFSPNDFIEVSKNNVGFYGVGSSEFPFVFKQVIPGDRKTIYIRSNKNEQFKQSKNTGNLIVSWLTTV